MPTETETLNRIASAYETRTETVLDGVKCSESTHARYNLEGALYDMDRTGKADDICCNTVRRVIKQLAEIERALVAVGLRD